MRSGGIAILLAALSILGCGGAKPKSDLSADGAAPTILLWPAFPRAVGGDSDWQLEFIKDLENTAIKNGFTPITPTMLAISEDPSARAAFGGCDNADCAPRVARAIRARLVLTRAWSMSGGSCVYRIAIRDLREDRELIEEGGEERRACTDKGLARPCLVAARMALQQAAHILRREAAAESERGADAGPDAAGSMEHFMASLDRMIGTLEGCGVLPDEGPDPYRLIELTVEFDDFGKLKLFIDSGPKVPFRIKECIDGRAQRYPYPAWPEGGDAVYKTFNLHLSEDVPLEEEEEEE